MYNPLRRLPTVYMLVCLLLLLTACGANSQANKAAPTPTPTAAPTQTPMPTPKATDTSMPIAALPPVGEWLDSTTYGSVSFVLDIQKVNSTTNVASVTTVSYACVHDYNTDGYP